MKTNLRRVVLSLGVLSLALCTGGETSPTNADAGDVLATAEAEPPTIADKADPAVGTVVVPDAFADTISGTSSTNVVIVQTVPTNLAPALADVVKLIQAGVHQDVVLAYVTNSTGLFNIGSKEILYLHDLGTPSAILTALIQKDTSPEAEIRRRAAAATQPLPPGVAIQTPATNIYPTSPVETAVNAPQPIPIAPPEAVETVVAPPVPPEQPIQEPVSVGDFETELSPYGSWVYVNGYGNCWRPTVAICNSDWRPYVNGGRWLWTDCGWYWYSDYSWGWAPFHYGRWFCPPGVGWVWYPDTCWGPAWVSWRYSSAYCGWAPLPPAAHWIYGWGFHYNSYYVGIGCEFGLTYSDYCFVPHERFCDRNVGLHVTDRHNGRHAFDGSKVVNNYAVKNRNVINNGAGVDHIAAVTRGNVKRVTLRDTTDVRDLSGRRERLAPDGQSLSVVRPGAAVLREGASPNSLRSRGTADASRGRGSAVVSDSSSASRPAVPSRSAQASTGVHRPQDLSRRIETASTAGDSANLREPAPPSGRSQISRPFAPDRPTTRAPIIITGNSSANQNSILSSPNGSVNSQSSARVPGPVSRPQDSARADETRIPSRPAPFQQREAVQVVPIQPGSPVISRPSNPAPSRPSYSAPASSGASRPAQSYSAPRAVQQSSPQAPRQVESSSSAPAQVSRGGGGGGNSGSSSSGNSGGAGISRGNAGGGGAGVNRGGR